MKQRVIIDTGPLVAFINRREHLHAWVINTLAKIEQPLLTCEAVIVETCFLLRNLNGGQETVMSMLGSGNILISMRLSEEAAEIEELLRRYQSVPMSLADACLVRMTQLYPSSELLTFDSDFRIYRKNRNQLISVIMPVDV
ncbi:PIN domain-containing protein [Komarekiella sp. 'clone 1']|uniref:PIN domain-containing protein n=1 Tax=Komarekiella delphini-convector SJRDD-AB1 TaxID=2593771 RepID=A0AA40T2J6_9NOST|nr:PIN domain-containing protein [Komarekiella delphini-convector]MBD6619748.1 PIN domain-containing protein [Komarekiella delphini-convector SJRDD-AB1]